MKTTKMVKSRILAVCLFLVAFHIVEANGARPDEGCYDNQDYLDCIDQAAETFSEKTEQIEEEFGGEVWNAIFKKNETQKKADADKEEAIDKARGEFVNCEERPEECEKKLEDAIAKVRHNHKLDYEKADREYSIDYGIASDNCDEALGWAEKDYERALQDCLCHCEEGLGPGCE